MRVLIAGAGLLGRQLVTDLTATGGRELVVVERDEARCDELADAVDALIIHGDAADPEILQKAQIDRADALVAATGSDAVNTVIAMLAHRFGVDKIVVRLSSNALRGALDEIGVTDVVTPTMAAAAMIDTALQGIERRDLALLAEGGLELAEIQVGGEADGQAISEVGVPDGALVVAVLHSDTASLAKADTQLREGDVILVVAESEDVAEKTRRRLSG